MFDYTSFKHQQDSKIYLYPLQLDMSYEFSYLLLCHIKKPSQVDP